MKVVFALLLAQLSLLEAQTKPVAQRAELFTDAGRTEVTGHQFNNNPISVWSGGALLTIEDAQSGAPILQAFDKSGQLISRFEFRIEGARLINVTSGAFARGFDGSLAIVGSAFTNDGRGASFLATVSPDGQKLTVIRLNPFVARVVTVAADGTIWTAGYEKDADGKPKSDYCVIRRFDRTGAVLDPLVLRSTLSLRPGHSNPVGYSHLVSARDGRVGWYSEGAGTYIEFSADGKILRQIPVGALHADDELRPQKVVLGVALCGGGSLFVSASWTEPSGPKRWGIYALDNELGKWNLLTRPEKWGMLYGCEGSTLAARTGESSIDWLEVSRRP